MRSPRLRLAPLAIAALMVIGCKDRNTTGELSSPDDAAKFESKHRKAFDDDYTPQSVELMGRAPNDVLDQQLFAERLGFADILAKVRVKQVFGKGRYQGRQDQYVAVEIEEVLMGELPKGTEPEQLLVIKGEDEISGGLGDASLLLFVKWAPGEVPSFHHHLMPAEDDVVEMIGAMVQHAQEVGVLGADGTISTGRKGRKARKKVEAEGGTPSDNGDGPPI